jgi:hypothetical protein
VLDKQCLVMSGSQIFLFASTSRLALGPTQPCVWLVQWVLSSGVKWLQHEADHPSSPNVNVKDIWSLLPFLWL